MTTVISRANNSISIHCDNEDEAKEWFQHLEAILHKMYPEDVENMQGELQVAPQE